MTDLIKTVFEDGVLNVALNRADKKNAITQTMYLELTKAILNARDDDKVRVVLITAEGKDFSSGNDIADFISISQGEGNLVGSDVFQFLKALADMDKPMVAAVRGRAVGVGLTMLLHCDMVVAAKDALLSAPFINLALAPEAASTLLLPGIIGYPRAFEMFALGEPIDGGTAQEWGLVNRAVPSIVVDEVAWDIARRLATRAPNSLRRTKALMRDSAQLWELMKREGEVFGSQMRSPEAMEAFTAFMEKRAPKF
ncbi:enoyl-CoA hydratase [Brevundimonas sp.]|uniref:enoyl-CoA hydratase n=1 Tax=Brevundimonas sp. TaxID=1871086 RepID=UPI002897A454|nr:enoyl-CoA hydratase [Brevundimonas sp.]